MKKQCLFISALMLALSFGTARAEVINSIHETEDGVEQGMKRITIKGEIPVIDNDDLIKNSVTLTVLKPGVGIDENNEIDLSEIDAYGDGSQIEYTNQITADENGEYSFSYTMSSETGNYLIRIGYNSEEANGQRIFKYTSPADFIDLEKGIDEAFQKKDEPGYDSVSKIIELVETYSKKGVLNIPVYEEIKDNNEILGFISNYILSFKKPDDLEAFKKKFEEGFVVEKLNDKSVDDVKAFFENEAYVRLLGINEEVINGFENNEDEQKDVVYQSLANNSLIGKDIGTLANDICDVIILSELDPMLWQGNLQVLLKYQNFLEIDFDDYDALSTVEKKNYAMKEFAKGIEDIKDSDEMKELFENSVEKGKTYSSDKNNGFSDSRKPSSGGGGGGTSFMAGVSDVKLSDAGKNKNPQEDIENEEKSERIFNDTENYLWAEEAIETLAKKDIISGDGNGKFRPGDSVKREEFLKMLIASLGLQKTDAEIGFSDVEKDKWYYDYVQGGVYYHLITGISKDEFGIGKPIKRADVAVILDRVLKMYGKDYAVKEIVYQDVLKSDFGYAYDSIYRVSEARLMNGTDKVTFEPARTITRAEAAVVIDRLTKLLENN